MGRIVKILAWLVAGFATLFLVAALLLFLFFDPNDFREEIAATVEEQTGRKLTIDGDINLSLFPWLAVQVGKTTVGDAPGFGATPMASFDNASFSVRLMPLLLGQEIVVGAADVDGLNVNLKIDRAGNSNWSDLVPESSGESDSTGAAPREIDINRIALTNATIVYENAESNERITLSDANLNVGRLQSDGAAVPFDGSLAFDVQPAALRGDIAIDTQISFDADTGVVTVSGLSVDGNVEGVASIPTDLRIASDEIAVDTANSSVTMQAATVEMLNLDIRADVEPFTYDDRITPTAKVIVDAFSPRELMTLFDIEPPVTADDAVLGSLAIDATAQLTTSAIEMRNVNVTLDDTRFTGTLSVPRGEAGQYRFDLSGDTIDLARYMEPAGDVGAAAADDAPPVEIPVDLIRTLNARGKATLERVTLGEMAFENIRVELQAGNGQLRMHPMTSDLFDGKYAGDVRVNASGNNAVLSLNERIENVNLAKLVPAMFDRDNVTGTINGQFLLSGRGADLAAIQRSLSGTMSFALSDGSYEGTDLWYELRRARAKLKGEDPPEPKLPPRTEFSNVTASGVVTNGVMKNDDLYAELPHMQLTGAGTVNLVAASVDYGLRARILEKPEFLQGATEEELEEFTEAVIPLKITGPLASPSVKPDLERLLRDRVEEEIKDKLKDKLGDLFG